MRQRPGERAPGQVIGGQTATRRRAARPGGPTPAEDQDQRRARMPAAREGAASRSRPARRRAVAVSGERQATRPRAMPAVKAAAGGRSGAARAAAQSLTVMKRADGRELLRAHAEDIAEGLGRVEAPAPLALLHDALRRAPAPRRASAASSTAAARLTSRGLIGAGSGAAGRGAESRARERAAVPAARGVSPHERRRRLVAIEALEPQRPRRGSRRAIRARPGPRAG